jgi:hypothetical protein
MYLRGTEVAVAPPPSREASTLLPHTFADAKRFWLSSSMAVLLVYRLERLWYL